MPVDIVEVDVTTQTAGFPQVTFGEVLAIGRTGSTADPNEVVQEYTSGQATTDFGTTSELPDALDILKGVGAPFAYCVQVDTDARSESFSAVNTGTLASTGVINADAAITVTVDGNAKTLSYTTVSPPAAPATGNAVLNTRTKEWKTGDSGAVVWNFQTFDDDALEDAVANTSYEIVVIPGLGGNSAGIDVKHYGILYWLKTWCDATQKMFAFATASGLSRADAQLLSAQAVSRHGVGIAHKSSDDAAVIVAGLMAVKKPWVTLLWKKLVGLTPSAYYLRSEVGDPNTVSTFEGGNGSAVGPMNVAINIAGQTVMSNGMTTDGIASNYAFADVTRTRNFMVRRIKSGLTALRLQQEKIPFTDAGLSLVESVIREEVGGLVTLGALSSFNVEMPVLASLTSTDKGNRLLTGVKVEAVLAGDVHKFEVALLIKV